MDKNQILDRMTYILKKEDMQRISIQKDADGTIVLVINVHEMKVAQAKRVINSIIIMYRFPFKLKIIHGYVHGTAIKEMLIYNFDNRRIVNKKSESYNPGVTIFQLAF